MSSIDRDINGGPTKLFFVEMLTKDISLKDAILDLIDNSVDGAMRSIGDVSNSGRIFEGYKCRLNVDKGQFEISDNCGGIPDDLLDTAFQLGRPRLNADKNIPTIGMYGIGMKRAIFKICESADVVSSSATKRASINYSREWLEPTNNTWELRIHESPPVEGDELGFKISSVEIRPEIAERFASSVFVNDLRYAVGEHFGYLIQRGFDVILNGISVEPRVSKLIFSPDKKVLPFDSQASINGVDVRVTIGFFRQLTREAELEEATELGADNDLDRPGITVLCNDRVIISSDTSALTGWGVGATPKYHPQFRAIAGVISFFSLDATKLPVATTKHDLDQSSEVFRAARNLAMEGIVTFTSFTNRWKGRESDTDDMLDRQAARSVKEIVLAADLNHGKTIKVYDNGMKYTPDLPKPEKSSKVRRIAFSRDSEEVKQVADFLLGDKNASPGDVGVAAWLDVKARMSEK
ncbi:ATP-binding protein [Falsirhodobacter xinxiangensis]|uniref:ATP-binding protein n=1 Tax=Falsirhodobacter xinxiangensis TaxID=2530049 RepID=UPI0010AA89FD|nr:ATP-binding protein [Rhodobacter xinxiangensis]